jgi:hypothetical protein
MSRRSDKIRTLTVFIGISLLVHLFALVSLGRFGSYSFAAPVNPLQAVMVELIKPGDDTPPLAEQNNQKIRRKDILAKAVPDNSNHARVQEREDNLPPAVPEKIALEAKSIKRSAIVNESSDIKSQALEPAIPPQPTEPRHVASATEIPPPLRTASEFLSSKSEKLSYLVSLRDVPVGSMELEAKNENGEIRITLRTKSNSALSGVYPVDNVMETRHIAGNFIITKNRQHEGTFSSDIGFTIFLRDKRVFWVDRIRKRYANETIPNNEVLDTLSSFYYLRNRPLQIGKTELLHIYDGDVYAPVPVEVLRQEEVRLRNLKKVDSLLLRHVKQKGGIFRRTGDMLIWITNDEHKVPVKLETTTPLGKVTVELVSSETEPFDKQLSQK